MPVVSSGLVLPMSLPPSGRIDEDPSIQTRDRHAVRVLIVEDRPVARKLLEDELVDGGLQVVAVARDGDEAIELVGRLDPDVVLMDVVMPGKDGIQTLSEIRRFSDVPVILLTGAQVAVESLEHVARRRGADAFFLKPSGPVCLDLHTIRGDLVAEIRRLARRPRHRRGTLAEGVTGKGTLGPRSSHRLANA